MNIIEKFVNYIDNYYYNYNKINYKKAEDNITKNLIDNLKELNKNDELIKCQIIRNKIIKVYNNYENTILNMSCEKIYEINYIYVVYNYRKELLNIDQCTHIRNNMINLIKKTSSNDEIEFIKYILKDYRCFQ